MQRAGRAGRVRPGKAFRLCTAQDYAKLPDVTVPEMQRSELQGMVLQVRTVVLLMNVLCIGLPWLIKKKPSSTFHAGT